MTVSVEQDYWDNLLDIANNYMENGLYQDAIVTYLQILENSPDVPEIYNNLGIAYMKRGDTEKALENFFRALELRPDFAEVLNNIAHLYVVMQINLDIALSYARKAVSIEEHSSFMNTLGMIYERKGIFDKAQRYFSDSIEKNPLHFSSYINLAGVYIEKKQYGKAVDVLKRLEEKGYSRIDMFLMKTRALKKIGRYADSHVTLMEVVRRYNEYMYDPDEEKALKKEIRSYFYSMVWTAALHYYRIVEKDMTDISFDKIRPYTKVFYNGEISTKDPDGVEYFINRNLIVESETYGINPDIFDFLKYFNDQARGVFRNICAKNQDIIRLAIREFMLENEKDKRAITYKDILPFIPSEAICPEGGEYILRDGKVRCTLHGEIY
ncbi:MAG: tetratricopeptide repeat protein [Candidatus Muiribacteriaceae bacterium]